MGLNPGLSLGLNPGLSLKLNLVLSQELIVGPNLGIKFAINPNLHFWTVKFFLIRNVFFHDNIIYNIMLIVIFVPSMLVIRCWSSDVVAWIGHMDFYWHDVIT